MNLSERQLIDRFLKPLATTPEALQLADDGAIIPASDEQDYVVVKDTLVSGIHFFADDPAETIAKKLLRVNLSDLMAMGALPAYYTLSLALPAEISTEWVDQFTTSLHEDMLHFGGTLIGGDTTAIQDSICLTLSAIGTVPNGKALTRKAAQEDDDIFVTGTLGDAFLGLETARKRISGNPALLKRYQIPQPPVRLGNALLDLAHAAIDISDGLVMDMERLCQASQKGALLYFDLIPISKASESVLVEYPQYMEDVVTGGDDYQLLFTAPHRAKETITTLCANAGITLTQIGTITETPEVIILGHDNQPMTFRNKGFEHYSVK